MAAAIFRYCVRHPTRILFIGLLVILVIFSKFLYPSGVGNKQINNLEVIKGHLSPAYAAMDNGVHGNSIRNAEKLKKESSPVMDHVNENSFKVAKGKDSSQNSALNKHHVEAEQGSKRIPPEETVTHITVSEEEKAENDIYKHELPDDERSDAHVRKKSPFEMLVDDQQGNKKAQDTVQLFSKKSANKHFLETSRNTRERTRKEGNNSLYKEQNNVLMVLAKVGQTSSLAARFKNCLLSICKHASVNLSFHIAADKLGTMTSTSAFAEAHKVCKHGLDVTHYNVEEVLKKVRPITEPFQHLFTSSPRSYFNDPIFFINTALHHFLPQNVHRIVSLDADLLFKSDIKQLFSMFNSFSVTNIFGLAREQQPVYRHIFDGYRDKNPGTKVGDPPPDGITGFNSGVVLVNVSNMHGSETYKHVLQNKVLESMANKYKFQGHLGDQDLYTLLSVEYSGLFYILPCEWNRQLCTYWRDHGYADVFDLYHNCSKPVHVYHGNCRTKMSNE